MDVTRDELEYRVARLERRNRVYGGVLLLSVARRLDGDDTRRRRAGLRGQLT